MSGLRDLRGAGVGVEVMGVLTIGAGGTGDWGENGDCGVCGVEGFILFNYNISISEKKNEKDAPEGVTILG